MRTDPLTTHARSRLREGLTALCLCLLFGCQPQPDRTTVPSAAQVDRLRAAYPQLRDGHFALIADFETPIHETIFNLMNASGTSTIRSDPAAGRPITGRTALRARLGDPSDCVLVSGESSTEWSLKRDWRDYDVLLMAIQADAARELTLELIAGRDESRRRHTASLSVKAGWNLVSLDLWNAAQVLPMDDVREMKLVCDHGPYPADLAIDDLLLSRDRQWLLGHREQAGALFIERQGERLNCGVGGLFEWCFFRGRIVGGYDLADDPNRLVNWVQNANMGPSPGQFVLHALSPDAMIETNADWSPLNNIAMVQQEIQEANPIRVILRCRGHAKQDARHTNDSPTVFECTYSIYATGCVHVHAALSHTDELTTGKECLSWRWNWGRDADWTYECLSPTSSATATENQSATAILSGPKTGDRYPRWVVSGMVNKSPTRAVILHGSHRGIAFLPRDARAEPNPSANSFHGVLLFGHDLGRLADHAQAMSSESCITVAQGVPLKADDSSSGARAIMNRFGCLDFVDEGGAVRVTFDGRKCPRWAPVVRFLDPRRRPYWVYVDHKLTDRTERLEDGSILLQMPSIEGRESAVECVFATPGP